MSRPTSRIRRGRHCLTCSSTPAVTARTWRASLRGTTSRSGFDGVAPGAKLIGLKIADDAHGAVSVTGMIWTRPRLRHPLTTTGRWRSRRRLSFGVIPGKIEALIARIDALIDSILAVHPDVVMTVAAGNDGPGLSTIGFPASAARVISVGATLPLVFSGGNASDTTADPIASFSSRGGSDQFFQTMSVRRATPTVGVARKNHRRKSPVPGNRRSRKPISSTGRPPSPTHRPDPDRLSPETAWRHRPVVIGPAIGAPRPSLRALAGRERRRRLEV